MQILDAAKIQQTLADLAAQILADPAVKAATKKHSTTHPGVALIGIKNRGDVVAHRLAREILTRYHLTFPVGGLDITMYRDDLSGRRAITIPQGTEMNFRVDDLVVILVDDVLETGRSIRAALDALVDFGRPRIIRALALVDRGRREYPIAADFIGVKLDNTDPKKRVVVHIAPNDPEDGVYLKARTTVEEGTA